MKQPRVKAQALALVLIVIVVSVIIAFAITSRVVEDIKQQGEERASTRAETMAESAIENLTLKIQSLSPETLKPTGASHKFFAISTESPEGESLPTLGLCNPNETDITKQCDKNSIAQINYYNSIIQFKLFDSESIEAFMVDTTSATSVAAANSTAIIHLKKNNSFTSVSSKLLVKAFERTATKELRVIGECVIGLNDTTTTCLPTTLKMAGISCPQLLVDTNLADTNPGISNVLGDTCFTIATTGANKVSTYRVKPILTKSSASEIPYIDVSVTGDSAHSYQLPIPQMAMITAGVYSGTSGSDQQVFQQSTRLVLLNKSVPEIGDYVLYNGSTSSIKKCKTSNDPNATCN